MGSQALGKQAGTQGQARLCEVHPTLRTLSQGSCAGLRPTWRQTRDFSSRYCSILAPSMAPRLLKWMSAYSASRSRLELSLRMVLAFPKRCKGRRGHRVMGHSHGQLSPRPTATLLLPECPSLTFQDGSCFQHLLLNHGCCPLKWPPGTAGSASCSLSSAPDSPLQRRHRQRRDLPVNNCCPTQSAPHQ